MSNPSHLMSRRLGRFAAGAALGAVALVPQVAGAGTLRSGSQEHGGTTDPQVGLFDPAGGYTSDSPTTCYGQPVTIWAGPGATVGTPGDDVIAGTDGNDIIYGMGGNDTICGFDGRDVLVGDSWGSDSAAGADRINGGRGDDNIYGGPGRDELLGSQGEDEIFGDLPSLGHPGAVDEIEGGNGDDTIIGGPGADHVWGDRRDGGFGHDAVDTGWDDPIGGDVVFLGAGDDKVLAQNGTFQDLHGGLGLDTCIVDEALDAYVTCEVIV